MPKANESFRIINAQHNTLIINEKGIPNTISIDRAPRAPLKSTNASVGKVHNAVVCEKAIIINYHKPRDGEVADIERCDTEDGDTLAAPK